MKKNIALGLLAGVVVLAIIGYTSRMTLLLHMTGWLTDIKHPRSTYQALPWSQGPATPANGHAPLEVCTRAARGGSTLRSHRAKDWGGAALLLWCWTRAAGRGRGGPPETARAQRLGESCEGGRPRTKPRASGRQQDRLPPLRKGVPFCHLTVSFLLVFSRPTW